MSTAYLFPGQGSQHVGMGQELYQSAPEARAVFDQADEQLGFPLSEICFVGPEEALTDTINQQPALFVTSLAMWQWLQTQTPPPTPAFMAGHSLGEFSALAAAGALTFSDGLNLVRRRGELMKAVGEQESGGMAAILALDIPTVTAVCKEASRQSGRPVQVANDNCPGQVVISGNEAALNRAIELAKAAKARKVIKLPVSIAGHSPLMAPVADAFARLVDETSFQAPQVPVIGNVTAMPLTTPSQIRVELKAQLNTGVAWMDSMTYLRDQGVDTVMEVGPGDTLLRFMKRIDRTVNRVKLTFDQG